MRSEAQKKAQHEYDKNNTKQFLLKLNTKHDADVIEKLESEENKQGFIKELVRRDMKNAGSVLERDSIRFLLLPIIKQYQLKNVSLFGSYARNEARPESDVDLLIGDGNYRGLFEFIELQEKLEKALGKKVDLITRRSLDENNSLSGLRFRENIEKDLVNLYD